MKNKFKLGDRVKVVSQNWGKPSMVGQVGTIDYIMDRLISDPLDEEYLVRFDKWTCGHKGHGYAKNPTELDNYWFLGGKKGDELEKLNTQLEFNFNG